MDYKIIHLDGRYTGSAEFSYRLFFDVNYTKNGDNAHKVKINNFYNMAEWLADNYGPGCDVDHFYLTSEYIPRIDARTYGPKWAWDYDKKKDWYVLYIKNKPMLMHIQLKWA